MTSTPPDVTERLPASLSARTVAALYAQQGFKADVSIGSLPFMIAPSDDFPYTRQTVDARKQQFDASPEPGEQSLSQWWTRNQDSWHRGAGVTYYEPGTQEGTRNRYRTSVGLDPWTRGELKLHKKMNLGLTVSSGQSAFVTSAVVSSTDVVFVTQNGVVKRWDGTSATTYTGGTGTPATAVAVAGASILVGTDQTILLGSSSGNTLANQVVDSAGAVITPYWVKGRIIATRGRNLYELTLASVALGTALYVHPDSGWTWTSVTETPTAILAAGYSAGGYGAIYRFSLITDTTTAGSSPTLGSAEQIAEFPPGETVHSIRGYLGAYLAIGTSKGIRIGILSSDSSVQYGPLTVETSHPVRALSARDTFVYAALDRDIEGNSGAVRIDLSSEIPNESLRFPYATDIQTHDDGIPSSIAFLGNTDRVALGVTGEGIYLQSATQYETSGTLETGRVRFGTSVPKVFAFTQFRADIDSTAAISVYSENTFIVHLDGAFNTDQDITLPVADITLPDLEMKFVLEASSDLLTSPILKALTVKAIPQPRTQREIVYPMMLLDREKDRYGVPVGFENAAWLRLEALEDLEQERALVIVKDWRTGESYRGLISNVRMVNTQPPAGYSTGFGGRVMVTVIRL